MSTAVTGSSCPVRRPPRILFVGVTYAGHRTRFMNLRAHTSGDARIRPVYREVSGWVEGGWVERIGLLPRGLRGRARGVISARPLATLRRPEVIWCSAREVAAPWLWSQLGPLQRPLVIDLDATYDQLEAMAPAYWQRPVRTGWRLELSRALERIVYARASFFTPWSRWAADGLRELGIPEDRIRVIPPGVDLAYWQAPARAAPVGRTIRLLFVGGDFERKGGRLLLEALAAQPPGDFELDIVTRDRVPCALPNVRVHRAEAGSESLRELYFRADLFVLPTRAECFGIAAVEALATGLPVIMGDVGGARDIVDHGENGWLITPTAEAIDQALRAAAGGRDALPTMGEAAIARAVRSFDESVNARILVQLLCEAASERDRRVPDL